VEPFIGQIQMVGFGFAPQGWATCDGQLLSISQNTALFSLLGTTYGGDGVTTFALPDLRGRAPIHQGQGPGLTSRSLGEQDGAETVTLISNQIPAHPHTVNAVSGAGNAAAPAAANVWAASSARDNQYSNAPPNTTLSPAAIGGGGAGQPHENMPPTLCVNFIIALEGIFPSRS
jgi:microcystin-dependent protein